MRASSSMMLSWRLCAAALALTAGTAVGLEYARAQAQGADKEPVQNFQSLEGYSQRRLQGQDFAPASPAAGPGDYLSLPYRGTPGKSPTTTAPEAPKPRRGGALEGSSPTAEAGLLTGRYWTSQPRTRGIESSPPADPQAGKPETPVAKLNSYVIHVKPGSTPEQIDKLLSKYGLKLDRGLDAIGTFYVSEIKARAEETGARTRSIGEILRPKIVRDLQGEAIVESVAVNTALSAHTLPRSVSTSIPAEGGTITWNWRPDATDDGNWALKRLRMPWVWSAILKHRQTAATGERPVIAFLDSGFTEHRDLVYRSAPPAFEPIVKMGGNACDWGHGTHVAGIAGAIFDNGFGIDGMVPDARIDAVPYKSFVTAEDTRDDLPWLQHFIAMDDALAALYTYVVQHKDEPTATRYIINISLGYNWKRVLDHRPDEDKTVQFHVRDSSTAFRRLALLGQNRFLFVVAAGNDSSGYDKPVNARWSSPFAFTGLAGWSNVLPLSNILVVEATGRNGERAAFSNSGGHVSAPGVDIMSTSAASREAVALCSGTSQAAPFVSSLAALLLELNPSLRPKDAASIIKASAAKSSADQTNAAADPVEAVLAVSKTALTDIADLNGDGKVDEADLKIFEQRYLDLRNAASDGVKPASTGGNPNAGGDATCAFPDIDLNGSGVASMEHRDRRRILGRLRTDFQVLELAWTSHEKTFQQAIKENPLPQPGIIAASDTTGRVCPR